MLVCCPKLGLILGCILEICHQAGHVEANASQLIVGKEEGDLEHGDGEGDEARVQVVKGDKDLSNITTQVDLAVDGALRVDGKGAWGDGVVVDLIEGALGKLEGGHVGAFGGVLHLIAAGVRVWEQVGAGLQSDERVDGSGGHKGREGGCTHCLECPILRVEEGRGQGE